MMTRSAVTSNNSQGFFSLGYRSNVPGYLSTLNPVLRDKLQLPPIWNLVQPLLPFWHTVHLLPFWDVVCWGCLLKANYFTFAVLRLQKEGPRCFLSVQVIFPILWLFVNSQDLLCSFFAIYSFTGDSFRPNSEAFKSLCLNLNHYAWKFALGSQHKSD